MQVSHHIFGKLLQIAVNEIEQSQTHRQHENSLCSLANRHRAQPSLNLHVPVTYRLVIFTKPTSRWCPFTMA